MVSTPLVMLRQMVRDRLGVASHDAFFTDSVLDSNINLALLAIEGEYRWPWNEKITELVLESNDGSIDVAPDWQATRVVRTKFHTLIEMTAYDLFDTFEERTGDPSHFALVNRKLYVRPTPAAGYPLIHHWYAEPVLLAADEDKPTIPLRHIGALVAKTAQLCSVREDDRPSADSHLAEYLQGIDRMRKETRRITRPTKPRVREGSWL